jgi:outer membrane protein OmpA-like peptidoglycan-associated protein
VTRACSWRLLAGCETDVPTRERRTAQGAAIGAVAGAVIGSATGGKAGTGAAVAVPRSARWRQPVVQAHGDKRARWSRPPPGTGVEVTRTTDNQLKVQVPSDISFATGSAASSPRCARCSTSSPRAWTAARLRVRVVGHTDSTGSDAINEPLSLRRAESVRAYLRTAASRRAHRGGRPRLARAVAATTRRQGRARNRRVEIFLREPRRPAASPSPQVSGTARSVRPGPHRLAAPNSCSKDWAGPTGTGLGGLQRPQRQRDAVECIT